MIELICFGTFVGLLAYWLGPWAKDPNSFLRRNSRGAFMRELNKTMLSKRDRE